MKKNNLLIIFSLILGLSFITKIKAQNVKWATKVDTVTSEYSNDRYAANEVLGRPNVDKQGRKSIYAWSVEANSMNFETVETAFIEVSFDKISQTQQLAVFESFNPGAVSQIYVSEKIKGNDWKRVYADTAVIERTGLLNFQKRDTLLYIAGKKKRSLNIFKKDTKFNKKSHHNIINVFFKTREVARVRIVLNLLAIDGWNQIDAIGITNSKDSIKYPMPLLADKSLIVADKAINMGAAINTALSEAAPIMSPNEKRIYFTKKEFDEKNSISTQNIWFSDLESKKEYPCNEDRSHASKKVNIWQSAEPVYLSINSIVPNTIVGFSGDGQYMYLSSKYEGIDYDCNCDSVFLQETSGLSVSKLDTVFWKKASKKVLKDLDTVSKKSNKNFITDKDKRLLISTQYNDYTKKTNIFFRSYDERKEKWSDAYYAGGFEDSPYSFNTQIGDSLIRYWLNIDSINIDSIRVGDLSWSKPKNVKIKGLSDTSNYVNYYITPDQMKMVLTQENKTSMGDRDLYVSFYDTINKIWSEPKNLGTTVNTVSDESSPFIDGDGESLYFSSAGHGGFGEFDIYVCRRLDDTWTNWTKPLNLGKSINTAGSDYNFKISQKSRNAYFTSDDKSIGCSDVSDIYSIKMGKAITIHIKGVTRNVNSRKRRGLYRPIGNVNIVLEAMKNNLPEGFRKIKFKSSKITGEYDIEITKMVEANKMTKFAFVATKKNCYQTNKIKNKINFEILNLKNPDWVVNIHQDLYLNAPKGGGYVPVETNDKETDDVDPKDPVVVVNKPETRVDTVYIGGKTVITKEVPVVIHDTITVYVNDFLIEAEGCPIIHSGGVLYGIRRSRTDEPSSMQKIEQSYQKYFGYNKTDIGVNESEFKKLSKDFLARLKNPESEITVYIISSASQVPTTEYCSNFELARKRAEKPMERIKTLMKKNGISEKRVLFENRYVVEGDEYNNDSKNIDKYRKYQYVKIWLYDCED